MTVQTAHTSDSEDDLTPVSNLQGPRVMRARRGFLAVSPQACKWRIGVAASTEDEAVALWRASFAAWEEMAQRPDPRDGLTSRAVACS